jgi:diadenosine tetraphosphate (Ap4A) HIT family hydrolase
MACELCQHVETPAWSLVWRDERLRVVRVLDAPDFPAFYRVIWNAHVAEFSDLSAPDRQHVMDTVVAVERALRGSLQPTKVNLAALGNLVPHLHWHVIARFEGDSHFPQPIWGLRQRDGDAALLQRLSDALPAIDARLAADLASVAASA